VKKTKKRLIYLIVLLGILVFFSLPELTHKNKGKSVSKGNWAKGSIQNAYLFPYKGKNFRYFSPLSYYILDDAYLHSSLHATVLDAYAKCEKSLPNTFFRIMECSNEKGGKMLIHRTHRNGLSIDFMVPKKKRKKQYRLFDHLGMWHYFLNFDKNGKNTWNNDVQIDFDALATHILALQNAAEQHHLTIKMVILKLELKDELFSTQAGKKIKAKGIYFARSLQKKVNIMHDEHYHVDFKIK